MELPEDNSSPRPRTSLYGATVLNENDNFASFQFDEDEDGKDPPMSPFSILTARKASHFDASNSMSRLRSSLLGAPQVLSKASTLNDDDFEVPSSPTSEQEEYIPTSDCVGSNKETRSREKAGFRDKLANAVGQIPAIMLIGIFHLMIGVPFGVSYFPMSWSPYVEEAIGDEGPFPLPGKEALGIRMFLFSTIVGQLAFTMTSKFHNPIGLQMVENVPFCHELAEIVIQHQGYGVDAISTLFVMFGLSSVVVGLVFYLLGKRNLGRVVYFFPTHVLIGCIGGIGLFLAKTGLEVTMATIFSPSSLVEHWTVLWVVFAFEIVLRVLDRLLRDESGNQQYTLISPIYFCMITPVFYFGLKVFGLSKEEAEEMGYFFPALDESNDNGGGVWHVFLDQHTWDMWTVIDFPTISWAAIRDAFPTLMALTLFSLIHVPINIPAFAFSTNSEADMNNELIAHGYSNMISGMMGGLQNYMAYTQSLIYAKSGGIGKTSGFAVAFVTSILFFIGPTIAAYIPRCMAGTLLLHVGIDLFLESIYDSYGKYDALEYGGILLIVVIMTIFGMEAAMVAGVIAAVSTYAVQSVAYLSPIRGSMPATTLRSSQGNRSLRANEILNSNEHGRSRILVVQLQGHLFFGNMAGFTDKMSEIVRGDEQMQEKPVVIIVDCSLVLGIDSSAAQAIAKLKDTLLKTHLIDLFVFVTGSQWGFPTQFPLTEQLSTKGHPTRQHSDKGALDEMAVLLRKDWGTKEKFSGSHVSYSLDDALAYAEDALISRVDPSLLEEENAKFQLSTSERALEDADLAILYLKKACPVEITDNDIETLLGLFEREVWKDGDFLWRQHSESDCTKLVVTGLLVSELEKEAGTTEAILPGNFIGELGMLNRDARMSSVKCISSESVVYSLSRSAFDELVATKPSLARYIDLICIKYLALRVQHVSNRIFETRCLPI